MPQCAEPVLSLTTGKRAPDLRSAAARRRIKAAVTHSVYAAYGLQAPPESHRPSAALTRQLPRRRGCSGRNRPGIRRTAARAASGSSGDPHLGGDEPPGECTGFLRLDLHPQAAQVVG